MPIFQLGEELIFPSAELANEDGILAVEGDLSPERVLLAYTQGIFPWPHQGYPLLWFSPDPRFVLIPNNAQISRSLHKSIRKGCYEIRCDTSFRQVMTHCALAKRHDQDGTWISEDMIESYCILHEMGFAHSIEAFENDELVGGLYGISLGGIFFGESMFAKAKDASKIAFATLIAHLIAWDFDLIDCQSHTEHLERFGAIFWPRKDFLELLAKSQKKATRRGKWKFYLDLKDVQEVLKRSNHI